VADDIQRASRWWLVWSLGGIAAWIGVTVAVAVTHDDPSDPGPILRTFAIAGGVFFAVTFGAAAGQMRRARLRTGSDLYRRAAIRDVSDDELRAAARSTAGIGPTYLFFGATVTALMLVSIGFGDEGLMRTLLWIAVGLVLIWAVYAGFALRRAFAAGDAFAQPLGLRLTEIPAWVARPSGGGDLIGAQGFGGERHGRQVVISQGAGEAVTAVHGVFAERRLTGPQRMVELTGEPWSAFKKVTVDSGPDGVVVSRRGNGAGRWMLTDLLLAEAVAAESAPDGDGPA